MLVLRRKISALAARFLVPGIRQALVIILNEGDELIQGTWKNAEQGRNIYLGIDIVLIWLRFVCFCAALISQVCLRLGFKV